MMQFGEPADLYPRDRYPYEEAQKSWEKDSKTKKPPGERHQEVGQANFETRRSSGGQKSRSKKNRQPLRRRQERASNHGSDKRAGKIQKPQKRARGSEIKASPKCEEETEYLSRAPRPIVGRDEGKMGSEEGRIGVRKPTNRTGAAVALVPHKTYAHWY